MGVIKLIKNDSKLTKEYVLNGLKSLDCDNLSLSDCGGIYFWTIVLLIWWNVLDEKFNSELGRPAYSRIQFIISFHFCRNKWGNEY